MPSTLTDLTEKLQGQVIDLVKNSQDAVVDAVRSLSSTIEGVLPGPAKSSLANNIPVATEAVDSAFGFAGKWLRLQHGFVTSVLSAVSPSTASTAKPAAKTTRAPKPGTTAAA